MFNVNDNVEDNEKTAALYENEDADARGASVATTEALALQRSETLSPFIENSKSSPLIAHSP